MNCPDPIARVRNTTATRRRNEQMRKLVAEYHIREMSSEEVAEFLKFSPSGARKYVNDLLKRHIIEVKRTEGTVGKKSLGHSIYGLAENSEELVKELLEELEAGPISNMKYVKPKQVPTVDHTRHLHIMRDDMTFHSKVEPIIVQRDPLVAALFGPAKQPI